VADGGGYSEHFWLRMAELCVYGHVQPSEFMDLTPAESTALAFQVMKLRDDERAIQLELTKGIMKSNGARLL